MDFLEFFLIFLVFIIIKKWNIVKCIVKESNYVQNSSKFVYMLVKICQFFFPVCVHKTLNTITTLTHKSHLMADLSHTCVPPPPNESTTCNG